MRLKISALVFFSFLGWPIFHAGADERDLLVEKVEQGVIAEEDFSNAVDAAVWKKRRFESGAVLETMAGASLWNQQLPVVSSSLAVAAPGGSAQISLGTDTSIGRVRFDPLRQALSAQSPRDRLEIRSVGLQILLRRNRKKTNAKRLLELTAGNFHASFALGLTFASARRAGIGASGFQRKWITARRPPSQAVVFRNSCMRGKGEQSVAPCAVTARSLSLANFRPQLRGVSIESRTDRWSTALLLSVVTNGIYQYRLKAKGCQQTDCKAVPVFDSGTNPGLPHFTHAHQTLPDLEREVVFAGNVQRQISTVTTLGATAFAAKRDILVADFPGGLSVRSGVPNGKLFAGVGISGLVRKARVAVTWEVSQFWIGSKVRGHAALIRGDRITSETDLACSLGWFSREFLSPFSQTILGTSRVFQKHAARLETRCSYAEKTGTVRKKVRLIASALPGQSTLSLSGRGEFSFRASQQFTLKAVSRLRHRSASCESCDHRGLVSTSLRAELRLRSRFYFWAAFGGVLRSAIPVIPTASLGIRIGLPFRKEKRANLIVRCWQGATRSCFGTVQINAGKRLWLQAKTWFRAAVHRDAGISITLRLKM